MCLSAYSFVSLDAFLSHLTSFVKHRYLLSTEAIVLTVPDDKTVCAWAQVIRCIAKAVSFTSEVEQSHSGAKITPKLASLAVNRSSIRNTVCIALFHCSVYREHNRKSTALKA